MGARPKPAKRGALRLLPVSFLDGARAGKRHPLREASLIARVAALACVGFLGTTGHGLVAPPSRASMR